MKKLVLSIGLNDKDTKKQEIATEKAMEVVSAECLKFVEGATIIPNCIGIYTHDNGEKVMEKSIRCEFYGENPDTVKEIACSLCAVLNQESIAYEETEIYSEMIR